MTPLSFLGCTTAFFDFITHDNREEFEKYMKESEDEKNIITEYFANDEEAPATVTSIEPLTELGEHYFKVNGADGNGEFETTVFIDDVLSVQVLPE